MKDYMDIKIPEVSTRFIFTLLRPTPQKLQYLKNLPDLKLYFYGFEKAPVSNLDHYQGYLEVKNPIKVFKLKHLLGNHYYVEVAKESAEQNLIYCRKSGTYAHYNLSSLTSFIKAIDN